MLAGLSLARVAVPANAVEAEAQHDAAAAYAASGSPAGNDRWQGFGELSGGCDAKVRDMVKGSDGQIYLAGDFQTCDGARTPNIARYDPLTGTFHAVGDGVNGLIKSIVWFQDELFVCGVYLQDNAAAVLRWNGAAWTPVGSGAGGGFKLPVALAMEVVSGDLVVAGSFLSVDGVGANRVARWDGSAWSAFGPGLGIPDGGSANYVSAIAEFGGELVVGGRFTSGVDPAVNIARWNGGEWRAMGALPGFVNDLLVDGVEIVAAGGIADVPEGPYQVRRWNGVEWTLMGDEAEGGFDQPVEALVKHDGSILAVGPFTRFGERSLAGLARWNGSTWVAIPASNAIPPGDGLALLSDNDALYIGAAFLDPTARGLHHVARLADGQWQRLGDAEGHGLEANVDRIIHRDGRVIAAGTFQRAGDRVTPGVAEWDGLGWQRLGEAGVSPGDAVRALEIIDGVVYAAGDFVRAGQPVARGIGRWSGGEWESLGPQGVVGLIWAIAEFQGEVVVGGSFSAAGADPLRSLARWNGQRWAPLWDLQGAGPGPNADIRSMAVWDDRLIVAGRFTSVSGMPADGLAAWDGATWSALPQGVSANSPDAVVFAWNDDLYVATGRGPTTLARLSGSTWLPLLSWPTVGIRSMAAIGDALYVGGNFTNLAGSGANQIARLRGGVFEAVSGGLGVYWHTGPSVHALAEHRGDLLVAGGFRTAGTLATAYIARLQPDVLDGIDLYAREAQPVAITSSAGTTVLHYQVDVGNRGNANASASSLAVEASSAPSALRWSCVPLAMSVANCPAEKGTGSLNWSVDLPPGSALRLLVEVEPQPDTVFQRLRIDLSGQPVPGGASNNPIAHLILTTAVHTQALFRSGFEPDH